jgi:hypothetical protein
MYSFASLEFTPLTLYSFDSLEIIPLVLESLLL